MIRFAWLALIVSLALPLGARAQIGVPQIPQLPNPGDVTGTVTGTVNPLIDETRQRVDTFAQSRVERLEGLARRNPDTIQLDRAGNPVRAGEVVVEDVDDATVAAVQAQGFQLIERTSLGELGIGFARFRAPRGLSIERALSRVRKVSGGRSVSADPLHFGSGEVGPPLPLPFGFARTPPMTMQWGPRIGVIDGGIDARAITGTVYQQGFAAGAPAANNHGTAIASLIRGGSGIRGAAPNATLYVGDVYGTDPAGGSATAIAKALSWMVSQRVAVVTVSLVGPSNPLLARAIAAAQARGTIIVAAVGNDGPAAPPAFPASYNGVVSVTGVDGGNRALIEAGRAAHLDYAAPGADMLAASPGARAVVVRGTSFAAPLVAARLSAFYDAPNSGKAAGALAALDREARDLGPRGPDRSFGRGLVCESCRTPKK